MSPTTPDRSRPRTGRRAVGVAAFGLLLGGGILLAGSSGDVELQLPSEPVRSVASGLPAPEEGAPISVGAGAVLCLNRPGAATVVEVSGEDASQNFSVRGFSLRPNPSKVGADQLGEVRGTLVEAGFVPGQHQVDAPCEGGGGYELGIQLARTGAGPASSRAFLVRWVSDTDSGTLRIPFAMVLCDASSAFHARCDTQPLMG